MNSTETTHLWNYGVIVAIWPIRFVVLSGDPPRAAVSRCAFAAILGHGEPPKVTAIPPGEGRGRHYISDCLASGPGRRAIRTWRSSSSTAGAPDRTGEIARRHAAEDPRVRVLTIEEAASGMDRQDARSPQGRGRGDRRLALVPRRRHAARAGEPLDPDGLRPVRGGGDGQPAPRAAVRDVLGTGRPAARRDRANAVVSSPGRPSRRLSAGLRQRAVHPHRPPGLRRRGRARGRQGAVRRGHRPGGDGQAEGTSHPRGANPWDRHLPDVRLARSAHPGMEPDPL